MTKAHRSTILIFCIIILNILDLILHIAIGQPEMLRITSNVFIITSGILLTTHRRYTSLFAVSLSLYIALNTLFIVLQGIGTAGALFIATTLLLGIIILRPTKKHIN